MFARLRLALPCLALAAVVAACATSASPTAISPSASAPGASSVPPTPSSTSGTTPSGRVNLAGLDVCSLLTEPTVQELTGSSVRFASQGRSGACFWGARQPVPPYVEIEVLSNPGGLAAYTMPTGCTIVPVSGVGSEAKGATCPGTQTKIYLVAFDRGVIVRVLVNAPERPLQPADIAVVANRVLQQILSR
jgi:hypothetical protein